MFKLVIDDKDVRDFLKRIDVNISKATNRMKLAMKGQRGKIALRAIRALGTVPGKPQYPIRWKSEKQRRAFFASDGFGGGVPTVRKNVIIKAWHADVRDDPYGGVITLTNPYDAWIYIQGSFVQPFHLDTGYVQLKDVEDEFYQDGTFIVADTWYKAADVFQ